MGTPYVGEIRMFGGNFAPVGWMFCAGQLLPISENEVLFQLIGTTYGGDGQETFQLPDLRGRVPLHQGQGSGLANRVIGEQGGVETVTLSAAQIPQHTHSLLASGNVGGSSGPSGRVLAQLPPATVELYAEEAPNASLANTSLSPAGGSQPHENRQPFLCVNFIISLFGVFPSPT